MDFENWLLLGIPLFFSLGWIAARIDIRQLVSESSTLPKGYFKGLNYLLNDQRDKAIDIFIELLKLNPENVELHFALGNLFRRRGEIERAIRVHQNLLSRPDLDEELKIQAMYELGQDYLKAGLLDRAEETFNALVNGPFEISARKALLEIYQREKEWARAIEAANAMQLAGTGGRQKEIAQFYCELAEDELVSANMDAAMELLNKAISTDRLNIRSSILMGDIHVARLNLEQAVLSWRKVEKQSLPHVALVAQRLMDAYKKLERPNEGLNLLKSYLAEAPSIDLLEVVFKASLEFETVDIANQIVSAELRRTPTLLGLDKLLDARLMVAQPEIRPELSLVKNLVHGYAQKLTRYQCTQCGFKARQFYWQCPGCSQWETYPPRRTEELNVMN